MKIVDLLKPRLNDNAPLSRVVPMSEGAVIPRIIHQTYFSRNLPDELKENIERIKGMNPGWEYRYYDDSDIDDFIRTNYGQYVHELFSRINPKYGAARADLFRYLLMYKIGGVYLDIKSSTGRPLNDVLKPADRYLLSVWDNDAGGEHQGWGKHPELRHVSGGEFQQWHIVAAPGHPFLRVVIANVLRNIEIYNPLFHGTGSFGVLNLTGPIAYTLAIAPILHRHDHRLVDCKNGLGFVYSIYGSAVSGGHKALFKSHYTQLDEPVVDIGFAKACLNAIFRVAYWLRDKVLG